MDRRYLEPQLQAILSNLIAMNGGYDWVSDYLERVAESGEESMDDRSRAELKAVQGVMDLIAQLSTEPDRYRLEPDGNDSWCEVCVRPDVDNTVMGQFGNLKQAVEFIEGLPQSEQMNKAFLITKCRGGQYTSIENIGTLTVPVEQSK